MTNEIIQYALENQELKLTSKEKRKHYEVLFFLLLFPAMLIFYILTTSEKTSSSITYGIIILVIAALILFGVYKLQQRKLRFKSVATNLKRKALLKIIKKVGKELEWDIETIEKNHVIARTHPGFSSGSWGEQITIIFGESQVLVNSICDLKKQTSLVSMGRNKKNMELLIMAIEVG